MINIYVLIIIAGVLLILGLLLGIRKDDICGPVLMLIAGTLFFIIAFIKTEPKAIDVYRGKTTLEITYRDSIPIDSVVIYKKD